MLNEVFEKHLIRKEPNEKEGHKMLTINPVNFNTNKKYISFADGNLNNMTSNVGILSLQAPDAKREFAGYMNITRNADMVKSNPVKAIAYKFVKAYNEAVRYGNKDTETTPKQISFIG